MPKPTWCFLCLHVPIKSWRRLSGLNRRCGELCDVGSSTEVWINVFWVNVDSKTNDKGLSEPTMKAFFLLVRDWSLSRSSPVKRWYVLICDEWGGSWAVSILGSGLVLVFPYLLFVCVKFHLPSFPITSIFTVLLVWGSFAFVHSLISFNSFSMEQFYNIGYDFSTWFLLLLTLNPQTLFQNINFELSFNYVSKCDTLPLSERNYFLSTVKLIFLFCKKHKEIYLMFHPNLSKYQNTSISKKGGGGYFTFPHFI